MASSSKSQPPAKQTEEAPEPPVEVYYERIDKIGVQHSSHRDDFTRWPNTYHHNKHAEDQPVAPASYCTYPATENPETKQFYTDFASEEEPCPAGTVGPDSCDVWALFSFIENASALYATWKISPNSMHLGGYRDGFIMLFRFRTIEFAVRCSFREYTTRRGYNPEFHLPVVRISNKDLSTIFTHFSRRLSGRSQRDDPVAPWSSKMTGWLAQGSHQAGTSRRVPLTWIIRRVHPEDLRQMLGVAPPTHPARLLQTARARAERGAQMSPQEVEALSREWRPKLPPDPFGDIGYPGFYVPERLEGEVDDGQPGSSRQQKKKTQPRPQPQPQPQPAVASGSSKKSAWTEEPQSCFPYGVAWNSPEDTAKMRYQKEKEKAKAESKHRDHSDRKGKGRQK